MNNEKNYKSYTVELLEDLQVSESPALYNIKIDDYYLNIFFNPIISSDKLYVLSPGYLERKIYTHPYFQRLSWTESINANCIIITDPTLSLHDDIGIAWFQGKRKKFALPLIVKVIDKFRSHLNVPKKRVIFFGSSAGGFASLMMSSLMNGASCVVNNPQTNVLNFRENIVDKMLERCYSGLTKSEVMANFLPRLSVVNFFDANKNIPNCIYIQNVSDVEHYNDHFIPFLTHLGILFSSSDKRNSFDNIIVKLYKNEDSKHNPAVYSFIKPYFDLAEKEFFS